MAKKTNVYEEDKVFHSCIIRSKSKAIGLITLFIPIYLATVILIFNASRIESSWQSLVVPIGILLIPIIAFPLIDRWKYSPWQARAQKYETMYLD